MPHAGQALLGDSPDYHVQICKTTSWSRGPRHRVRTLRNGLLSKSSRLAATPVVCEYDSQDI